MQKGDIVTVYEDPVTQQHPEGRAELRKLIKRVERVVVFGREMDERPPDGEYWRVEFVDDPCGGLYDRWIYPPVAVGA